MIGRNPVKEKIEAGKPVLGTWNTLASSLVTEILAHGGFDFLIIDFEHGPFDLGRVHDYVNRCERYGCSPIVRLPTNADWMILQALDQGAHGVIVPHVENKQMAEAVVRATRYFPRGSRGFTPFSKAGGFTNIGAAEYVQRSKNFPITTILVESMEGLRNLESILEIDEVDIVYFGAYDISRELGVQKGIRDPKVLDVITQGAAAVNRAGKCAGGFVAESIQDIQWLLDIGIRFITYDVDSAILSRPVQSIVSQFQETQK